MAPPEAWRMHQPADCDPRSIGQGGRILARSSRVAAADNHLLDRRLTSKGVAPGRRGCWVVCAQDSRLDPPIHCCLTASAPR